MSVIEKGTTLFFLDTNIFVYSFDSTVPDKQRVAQQLIQHALRTQRGVISSQIVQEFLNVALRKFAETMTLSEAEEYLEVVLSPLCQHYPSITFYQRALTTQANTGYSWYDSLVVAAALEAGCQTLLSEDMQHGQVIQSMTILNPFANTTITSPKN